MNNLTPGTGVRYFPSIGGPGFPATVDGPVWNCGSTPVVALKDLPPEYGRYTGTGRNRVVAAALFALELLEETA
jgi:hypothetical protein